MDEIGPEGQAMLKKAKVLVIGAGGLGCPVLQYLTAAGIGTIGMADHDVVDVSNLQRQVLYGYSSVGKLKIEEAKKKLEDLNPHVQLNLHPTGIQVENALELISPYDIIVDCTDNFGTRYLINDACILMKKPFVYGAIHKFEGQVSVFNFKGGPSYRCLYPKQPKEGLVANCAEIGVIGILPGIVGSFQANEVLKMILEKPGVLSGKLLVYHSLHNSFHHYKIEGKEHPVFENGKLKDDYHIPCGTAIESFEAADLDSLSDHYEQLIDVREIHEEPKFDNWINIPLSELEARFTEIDPQKNTLVICRSGKRSEQAITWLNGKGFDKLTNLKGGIKNLIQTDEELF